VKQNKKSNQKAVAEFITGNIPQKHKQSAIWDTHIPYHWGTQLGCPNTKKVSDWPNAHGMPDVKKLAACSMCD